MAERSLDAEFLVGLRTTVGAGNVLTDPADRLPYGYDNSRRLALPDAVVFAQAADEVREVVALCNRHRQPLVARGRGTNTTGATVPVQGGVVLSLERMNRILEIRPADRLAVVEPGVTNAELQAALVAHGLFWPPDPSSAAYATVGGNLACNAAGPQAVKYGTPRDNTLGLRAVTGAGEDIRTGVLTTKGVVGYDLTRLLIGSEGTLAVITAATLRLTPRPPARRTLRALYRDMGAAARAVARIMAQPETPCALEFIDGNAIAMIRQYQSAARAELPEAAGAMLMIEVDGSEAAIEPAAEAVAAAARGDGLLELHAAADAAEVAALWETRKALSPALRTLAPKKINEDVVVPVSRLAELVEGLQALSARHGVPIVNFGHAGNGNVHVNLLGDAGDPAQLAAMHACLEAVFDLVLKLGGTLSGEHGVGLEKRAFVGREIGALELALMRQLKRVFDPHGILNPGKLFPDAEGP
jgi:D-lactate dehydrogenase (quinone)